MDTSRDPEWLTGCWHSTFEDEDANIHKMVCKYYTTYVLEQNTFSRKQICYNGMLLFYRNMICYISHYIYCVAFNVSNVELVLQCITRDDVYRTVFTVVREGGVYVVKDRRWNHTFNISMLKYLDWALSNNKLDYTDFLRRGCLVTKSVLYYISVI